MFIDGTEERFDTEIHKAYSAYDITLDRLEAAHTEFNEGRITGEAFQSALAGHSLSAEKVISLQGE